MTLALPQYDNVFLERDWPKDRQGLLYTTRPIAWRKHLVRDEASNALLSTAENVYLALTECPDLDGLFWWEIDRNQVYLIGKLPGEHVFTPDRCRPMRRDDLTDIQIFLQREGLKTIDRGTVFWCIRNSAKRYHRFRLEWWSDDDGL